MLYIKEGTFEANSAKKILKAEDYSAYLKAEEIIVLARKKAADIIQDSRRIFEQEKKRGYEEGMDMGNKKIAELMLESAAKSVENFSEFEDDVIEVVDEALRKIIGEMDSKDLISRVVKKALSTVRNQKKVTIIVNPVDSEVVRNQINELLTLYNAINTIDILVDNRISPGGCKLETEMGVVDASLEVQLEALKKSLIRAIK